jgi:hypothetical protein
MLIPPNRLLAVLLTLFVAFAPTGSAFAAGHACGKGNSGMPMQTGHAEQMPRPVDIAGDNAAGEQSGKCSGCSSHCCSGNVCSAHACGSAVAVVMSSYDPALKPASGGLSSTHPQMALSERLTSLFRPPRT